MYRLHLPGLDCTLLLAPPWRDLSTRGQVGVVLLGLLPLMLAAWLYRFELRLVRRSVAGTLLGLRCAVLVFLSVVIGLQPVVARSVTESLPGRVLVALDLSDSMTVTDPQRPLADKLRLARRLGLAQGQETEDQISQRMDALTRGQLAWHLLADDGLGLLQTLRRKHEVEVIGFARQSWDLPQPAKLPAGLVQAGPGTDLGLPLLRALQRSAGTGGKIIGVVVLTDGQHNWGPSPAGKARELGEQHIPLYPVPLGHGPGPPDIALVSIKAPSAVFKDVDVTIETQLRLTGIPGQDVIVEIHREKPAGKGEPTRESLGVERIRHDGTDRMHTVSMAVRLTEAGMQLLRITARPLAAETAKRSWPNSRRLVPIHVTDDKARVLLIDGEARWEYHYLATALGRDPTLKLDKVLFQQPLLGRLAEDDLVQSGHPARTLPAEPDALSKYDCIILGDVSPEQLSLGDRSRLEKFVADRGGTLVLVAGKRFLPLAFLEGQREGGETDPLLKLLPILEPRLVQTQKPQGFRLRLTHEGQRTPYLQMDPAADQSGKIWSELPGHFWGVVGKTKPGAVALAVGEDSPDAPPANAALLVRQHYGFGRVVYLGLDSTWRWRFKVGDTYHHRFWGQLIRWAAADKPLVGGNEYIRFGTREAVYREGQQVELVVRLGENALLAGAPAGMRVFRVGEDKKEEALALVPLAPLETQPRVLEGRLSELPPGHYRIEPVLPGLEDKLQDPGTPSAQRRASFQVAPPESTELVELAVNRPLLEELAARSGGQVFAPEDAAALAEHLVQQTATRITVTERRLWQEGSTLLVVLLLLTGEWVVRKWAGLP